MFFLAVKNHFSILFSQSKPDWLFDVFQLWFSYLVLLAIYSCLSGTNRRITWIFVDLVGLFFLAEKMFFLAVKNHFSILFSQSKPDWLFDVFQLWFSYLVLLAIYSCLSGTNRRITWIFVDLVGLFFLAEKMFFLAVKNHFSILFSQSKPDWLFDVFQLWFSYLVLLAIYSCLSGTNRRITWIFVDLVGLFFLAEKMFFLAVKNHFSILFSQSKPDWLFDVFQLWFSYLVLLAIYSCLSGTNRRITWIFVDLVGLLFLAEKMFFLAVKNHFSFLFSQSKPDWLFDVFQLWFSYLALLAIYSCLSGTNRRITWIFVDLVGLFFLAEKIFFLAVKNHFSILFSQSKPDWLFDVFQLWFSYLVLLAIYSCLSGTNRRITWIFVDLVGLFFLAEKMFFLAVKNHFSILFSQSKPDWLFDVFQLWFSYLVLLAIYSCLSGTNRRITWIFVDLVGLFFLAEKMFFLAV